MDDTLGDTLAIKVSEQVDQVEVLEKERTILANTLELLGMWYGSSIGCGVDGLLRVLEGRSLLVVGTHDYRSEGLEKGEEEG